MLLVLPSTIRTESFDNVLLLFYFPELEARKIFADFLRGLVECDPNKRWTPSQVRIAVADFHPNIVVSYYWYFRCHFFLGMDQFF
jgi:hypothetical protein